MKKKMKDMTFEEFKKWCNMRVCDGCWSVFAACFYIEAINQVLKVKPLFWRKKWERIKNEYFNLDAEYELD